MWLPKDISKAYITYKGLCELSKNHGVRTSPCRENRIRNFMFQLL